MTEENIFCPEFIPFYVEEVRKYNLTPTEGLVYWFVRFYTKIKNNWFYFKSEQLSEIIKVWAWTIDNCVSSLKQKGLFIVETKNIWFRKVRKIFLNFDEVGSSQFNEVLDLTIQWASISLKNEIKREYKKENNKKNKEKIYKKENFLKLWELENVKLTEEEKNKLLEKYWEGKTNEYIEKLSLYIWAKWDKYKSHYAVILTWMRNEEKGKVEEKRENNDYDKEKEERLKRLAEYKKKQWI